MAALDFPTATAAGQTFEADTGVIYVYVGTPPNGFWSANATVSGQAALDARYVQVAGDSMTGALNVAGNVGIGTTSPTTKVEVVDTLQATANNDYTLAIRGNDSGTDGESAQIFLGAINATTRGTVIAAERQSTSNNHDLIFKTSAASAAPTERVRIDSSGNVGIGTTNPGNFNTAANKLVVGTGSAAQGLTIYTGTTNNGSVYFADGTTGTDDRSGAIIYDHSGNNFRFHTAATERMRIDSSGNVGIGTTPATNRKVHIQGTGFTELLVEKSDATTAAIMLAADASVGSIYTRSTESNSTAIPLTFHTGNDERMRIDSSGKVQIGRTSPLLSTELTVSGDNGLTVGKTNGSRIGMFGSFNQDLLIIGTYDDYPVVFRQNNNEAMRIDSSGRLLVGTSSFTGEASAVLEGSSAGGTTQAQLWLNRGQTNPTTDNVLGQIIFGDATASGRNGAMIQARVDSSWGSGDYPSRLGFFTTADGASSPTERMIIKSSGNVGIGTTSPGADLHVRSSGATEIRSESTGDNALVSINNSSPTPWILTQRNDTSNGFSFRYNGNNYVNIDTSGNVGIGTTSPGRQLQINGNSDTQIRVVASAGGSAGIQFGDANDSVMGGVNFDASDDSLQFRGFNNSEAARIDSSKRLLVGASSAPGSSIASTALIQVQGRAGFSSDYSVINARAGYTPSGADAALGFLTFCDSNNNIGAWITAYSDGGGWTSGSNHRSRLLFSTTANGASSPTERMRIDSAGNVLLGTTYTNLYQKNSSNDQGASVVSNELGVAKWQGTAAYFNRMGNDGTIINFFGQGTSEGSISLSGNTISYNGAHLSRWSQLPGNAIRVAILRGTVLSNIDEMCVWGDENNEQLNRMKISDVEGDRNVSGVFQAWDEDDDEYTDDFYCAMTGDFIIRIGKDVTVERGDLLMSAGDGTAKPQEDDIIRSKTIAKVTSTHVSETYADGSYCVPCVLMAC